MMRAVTMLSLLLVVGCDGGDSKNASDTGLDCAVEPTGDLPPVVLDCDAFGETLVLSDDPERAVDYLVECSAQAADLTIEAGTVVAFGEDAGLIFYDGDQLQINGEECSPVVLKGAEDTPGHWRGILIDNDGVTDTVTISHTEIRHAGGKAFNSNGDLGSIILWADSILSLEDSTIVESASNGLNLTYGGSAVTLARNHFEGNADYAILAQAEYGGALDTETTFSSNGVDGMSMYGDRLPEAGTTWVAATAPYRILEDGVVSTNGAFTIEAGARIEFEPNSGISVGGSGALYATGTEEAPIVLTGVSEERGAWRGIIIDTEETVSRLAHTEIWYAGGGPFNSNGDLGGLIVWSLTAVELDTVTIAESASYGLNLTYNDADVSIEGASTFTGNADAPVVLLPEYGDALNSESTYAGNDFDYVLVSTDASLDGDNTWRALDVPWRLRTFTDIFFHIGIVEGSSLTIEAGAEVVAEQDTGFEAGNGAMHVAGTEDAPVRFSGADGATWAGFLFEDPDDENVPHVIEHAEISDAGSTAFNSNGDLGAIVIWAETSASITDTFFSNTVSKCAINAPYNDDEVSTIGSGSSGALLLCDD